MSCKCCFPFDCSRPLNLIRRYSSRTKSRKIVLMLVGLDNAGKTSTAKRLARESVDTVVPTVGFNAIKLKHRGYSVVIFDLGGSAQIRGIWPRYFGDVHGVIFVVDSSDLDRIDESRKVLEELLADDKLTGKPLLLLGNKQDREGALDEIDMVERLGLELLVNQQRCPTLVETCSAAGPPSRNRPQMDPGILNGYRWLVRRIISEYDKLNSRVEQDTAEQRAAVEAARQDWLRRQETEQQVDSLPSEWEENPFRPIATMLAEQNGQIPKQPVKNGHVIQVESLSDDSPDSSSHTVGESSERGIYIPLHSPKRFHTTPAEPDIMVISEPVPCDVVTAVREQFEWKMEKQKRKKLHMWRSNRTAPSSAEKGERVLPPLKVTNNCPWARPSTAKSLPSHGWGLTMSLEEVKPPSPESPRLQVVHSPRTLNTSDSDEDDVICAR